MDVFKKDNVSNVELLERRKHWRDRRSNEDRRNPARLYLASFECRGNSPRRKADVSGELADGEVWWNKDPLKYE